MTQIEKYDSKYAQNLIETSHDPLVSINAEGKITDVNAATLKATGMTRKGLLGSDFSNCFTDINAAQNGFLQAVEKGFVSNYPLTIKHKNGNQTAVSYTASVQKDSKGNVLGVFAAIRDVAIQKSLEELEVVNKKLHLQNEENEKLTQELLKANKKLTTQNKKNFNLSPEINNKDTKLGVKEEEITIRGYANKELKAIGHTLKQASQYTRSLIEASRDPLITVSPAGKITDMNEAWAHITEKTREQIKGTDFFDYFTIPKKAREGFKEIFKKGFVVDFPLTLLDGKLIAVLFNGSVYKDEDGNVLGAVLVARDITEQKRIATELMEAKVFAELAAVKAQEATANAEKAMRVAEDAAKAKQQFLSNMSHEIRTPMNAIIGFTKVIMKTDLTAKQREYLSAIKVSGNALIVLINDILDLAKVDAGKMEFEKSPFKLQASISAMIHLFEIRVQEKNLTLIEEYDHSIPAVLMGDSVRLHQILINLISNAAKFTSKGGITVGVKLLKENTDKVTIEFAVTDTGIGIAANKIGGIFDNFQQASHDTSKHYGGTGLGLAIVKQLVEAQGGTVEVTSAECKGSRFSFVLDFDKTDQEAVQDNEDSVLDPEIKNIKVLVVEDMPLNQLLMKTLLDEFGFERDIAENGKIAIEKLQNKSYDIILMDLQMPEMNGFEATAYIRNEMNSKIPILALTADVTTVDLEKCTAVGMNDYLAKPLDEKILYNKIVNLVSKPNKLQPKPIKKEKCINLSYLDHHTKSNPQLMVEMITLYVEQTPPLIEVMKKSFLDNDWSQLSAAVHKMIPSFMIVGIDVDFENMARQIQEHAENQQNSENISYLVEQIERVCIQACDELKEELKLIKLKDDEK